MAKMSRLNLLHYLQKFCPLNILFEAIFVISIIISGAVVALGNDNSSDISQNILARAELKNGDRVKLSVAGLSIMAKRSATETGWNMDISGKTRSGPFRIRHRFEDVADYPEEILILELDPSNETPEIMFSAFTGGAHCCTLPIFLEEDEGKWISVAYPMIDGGPPLFEDINHDGKTEIVTFDQSFLYTFDCYACSWSPLRIETLRTGEIIDTTHSQTGLARNRQQLVKMEREAENNKELWHQNGFLAGWVAIKALLGEENEAWNKMLRLYDHNSDFQKFDCKIKLENIYECPDSARVQIAFPVSLERFLKDKNYLPEEFEPK